MKYCSNKDINILIKQLIREGWEYKRGSKHNHVISPGKTQKLTVAKSPSDHRCFKNFRQDVRRARHAV